MNSNFPKIEIEMAVQLLPDEVIVEILSILPAKSLLRCRLVCKSWLSLIKSTEFKLMHLRNFNQLNPRYFLRRFDFWGGKQWFRVHLDDEAFTFDRSSNVPFPFHICLGSLWYRIIGCCNGVVCLSDDDDRVILWNPSIRRKLTLTLPLVKVNKFQESLVALGFGYDKMSDDYKLVRLAYTDVNLARPRAEVYALKTGRWREVVFPDHMCCIYIHYERLQIFSNGCVHWIASDRTYGDSRINSIMTFDITTELFGEIPLPDDLLKVMLCTMVISVVDESLAVTYYHSLINEARVTSSTYKIWVMKEYNNPTSWTLMYNMHYPDIDMGKPLQVRTKGDMIMESCDGNIIVYNYYSGYVCRICAEYESTKNCWTYVDKYQESLALLDVGHSVSEFGCWA